MVFVLGLQHKNDAPHMSSLPVSRRSPARRRARPGTARARRGRARGTVAAPPAPSAAPAPCPARGPRGDHTIIEVCGAVTIAHLFIPPLLVLGSCGRAEHYKVMRNGRKVTGLLVRNVFFLPIIDRHLTAVSPDVK